MNSSNDAFYIFFKFDVWYQPENINITANLYKRFEKNNKISLWIVLTNNKFKLYNYDSYSEWKNYSIIDMLLKKKINDIKIDDEYKLKLISSYYTNNSNEKLITYIIGNYNEIVSWDTSYEFLTKLMNLKSILLLGINKNNLVEILEKNIHELLFEKLNSLLSENDIYNMSSKEATELFIKLCGTYGYISIETINKIGEIKKYFKKKIDINEANDDGYNLYSYLVASHELSMIRSKKNIYNMKIELVNNIISKKEAEFNTIKEKLSELGFKNNDRKFNKSKLDEHKGTIQSNTKIDGVYSNNYCG
jgi:hypothetical protein